MELTDQEVLKLKAEYYTTRRTLKGFHDYLNHLNLSRQIKDYDGRFSPQRESLDEVTTSSPKRGLQGAEMNSAHSPSSLP